MKFGRSSNATNGYDVKMDSGSFTVFQGVIVDFADGYYQTGGIFTAYTCLMNVGNMGVEFGGGNVKLGNANTRAALTLLTGNLTFNGAEYDVKIFDGGWVGTNQSDSIGVNVGTIAILGNSKLNVTILGGNGMVGETWIILIANANSINGDFALANKIFPPHINGPDPNSLPRVYRLYYTP